MYTLFIKLFLITILTFVFLSCSTQTEKDQVKLALDWYPNANHLGLYIALDEGYFEDQNLEVEIYTPSDPSTVLQTVAAGSDDFGMNYQPDVLIARDEGVPVVSVLGMVQHPLNSMMTLKSSGIDSPDDLKGKKVGYPGIPWNEDALATMLQTSGISISDVEVVNVGWELGSSLFQILLMLLWARIIAMRVFYWKMKVTQLMLLEWRTGGFPIIMSLF